MNTPTWSKMSTSFIGTQFEISTLHILSRYGFSLRRIGGANDKGIDLCGHFLIPNSNKRVPILVQCKMESKKIGPKYIRELSGVLASHTPQTLGLFASHSPFSQQALFTFNSSPFPLIVSVLDSKYIPSLVASCLNS